MIFLVHCFSGHDLLNRFHDLVWYRFQLKISRNPGNVAIWSGHHIKPNSRTVQKVDRYPLCSQAPRL
ncbi:hypothetical protein ABT272_43175 [Streptomyces sp900105245]|uniref:Transposase n=1 Tax=Streptomyces sp. 900105245 TaxID=3154379 RepID=A0ABV1UL23_9ACTN